MSNANFVTNSSNTSQQYEALGPDQAQPHIKPRVGFVRGKWPTAQSVRVPSYTHLPMYAADEVPEPAPVDDTVYAIADTGMYRSREPESGNAVLRSVVRFRVYQDPILMAQAKES